jgi:formamidopyrimidine-DNA glycosylase
MPELPDVETFRRYAVRRALHRRIDDIEVVDSRILDGVSARALAAKLRGKSLESAVRHGKYLFLPSDNEETLLMHFGMTGKLAYAKGGHGDERYDKVRVWFEEGHALIYQCRRLLGTVRVVGSIEEAVGSLELGPDARGIKRAAFRQMMGSAPGMVKSTLMDQSRIAGIGNIYSDEILFRAGLNPRRACKELDREAIDGLHRALQEVLKTAIAVKADPAALPEDYLLPHRTEGGRCPRCGGKVRTISVGGRRGWYCPSCQT